MKTSSHSVLHTPFLSILQENIHICIMYVHTVYCVDISVWWAGCMVMYRLGYPTVMSPHSSWVPWAHVWVTSILSHHHTHSLGWSDFLTFLLLVYENFLKVQCLKIFILASSFYGTSTCTLRKFVFRINSVE